MDAERSGPLGEPENVSDSLELAVAAEMARQYRTDSRSFLKSLAELLERALPGQAEVTRAGLFGGDKRPIRRIEVAFGDSVKATRYLLVDENGNGSLTAARTQIVRGVALKTEPMEVAEWIEAVGAAIARRAEQDRATRDALAGLL